MSVQTDLLALLNGNTDAGINVFPMVATQGVVAPYITYQRIVTNTENTVSGSPGLSNTRMQIDVYAKTYAQAQSIATQVDQLVSASSLQCWSMRFQDVYEDAVRLFRVILEYSIWHS